MDPTLRLIHTQEGPLLGPVLQLKNGQDYVWFRCKQQKLIIHVFLLDKQSTCILHNGSFYWPFDAYCTQKITSSNQIHLQCNFQESKCTFVLVHWLKSLRLPHVTYTVMLLKTFTVLYFSYGLVRGGFGDCHVAYKLESLNRKYIFDYMYIHIYYDNINFYHSSTNTVSFLHKRSKMKWECIRYKRVQQWFKAKKYLKTRKKRYFAALRTTIPRSIANKIIKIKTLDKYKTIDLKMFMYVSN